MFLESHVGAEEKTKMRNNYFAFSTQEINMLLILILRYKLE